MEDDLDAAVRQLARALRARDPRDPAVRLLGAAVEAAGQLRQLDPDEARRRVAAAVRVLGVLAPDPDTRSHVRPGAAREDELVPPSEAPTPDASTARRDATRPGRRSDPPPGSATRTPTGAWTRPPSASHRAPASDSRGRPRPLVVSAGADPAASAPREAGARALDERPTRPWGGPPTTQPADDRATPGTRGRHRVVLGQPPAPGVSQAVSELARAWAELGRGALPSEPIELLAELVRTGVPEGPEAVRFHLALVRGVDIALGAARYLPCERALAERAAPLLRAAAAGARELGVRVHPSPEPSDAPAPCPVQTLPAYGAPSGAVVWVDQHGFAMADGRSEPAVVRVAVAPAPPWFEAMCEGYAAVVDAAATSPEGGAQARAYRAWLDELPGLDDEERRCTTLRYAATAVFDAAQLGGPGGATAARLAFARLAQELEHAGSYVIPLDAAALSDARRYELVLRPGVGAPRLVRPGFQGPGQVVQQRARVLADPGWLGTMETSRTGGAP